MISNKIIEDLLYDLVDSNSEPNEEDLAPTERAIKRIINLLIQTKDYLPKGGILYRDSYGGLRIDWRDSEPKNLTLYIDYKKEKEDYIYWSDENNYFIDTPVNFEMLIKWFKWLDDK